MRKKKTSTLLNKIYTLLSLCLFQVSQNYNAMKYLHEYYRHRQLPLASPEWDWGGVIYTENRTAMQQSIDKKNKVLLPQPIHIPFSTKVLEKFRHKSSQHHDSHILWFLVNVKIYYLGHVDNHVTSYKTIHIFSFRHRVTD